MGGSQVWEDRGWLARVRSSGRDGRIWGTGFAVTGDRVVSCAHVVKEAGAAGPGGRVFVDFPLLDDAGCWAVVLHEGWAPEDGTRGDTTLLELEDPPSGLLPVPVRAVRSLRSRQFSSYGVPEGYDDSVEVTGTLAGPAGKEWQQLEVDSGLAVEPGFSGGPVWSHELGAVVAMVTNRDTGTGGRVAFAVPLGVLAARSPTV